ncbi:hypothetical protein EDD86DRAFT_248515 [Gorgonomyces haynaldii]|nr:hypothetical protein EDD86DRAFT_248515 [Gorgonomyces haynaldii]
MLTFLPTLVSAGTTLIKVSSNYETQTINLYEGDSIVWEFHNEQPQSVTQVQDAQSCQPAGNGFDSGSIQKVAGKYPNHFYKTFTDAGVYYYASTNACAQGFRGIVNVQKYPVNQLAVMKWQEVAKMQQSFAHKALPLMMLLPVFFV